MANSLGDWLSGKLDQLVLATDSVPHFVNDSGNGFLWIVSSGSTQNNKSKWIAHTRDSIRAAAKMGSQALGLKSSSRYGRIIPQQFIGGLMIEARCLFSGCEMIQATFRWNPLTALQWLIQEKISIVSLVPTQIYDLVKISAKAPPTLECALVGGDYLDPNLLQSALQLGWPIRQSYGMTETASFVALADSEALYQPLKEIELGIDSATQRIQIRSPSLFAERWIWRSDQKHNEYVRELSSQPWLCDDIGRLHTNGFEVLGRADDWIKINSKFYSLKEIERLWRPHLEKALGSDLVFIVIAEADARSGKKLNLVIEKATIDLQRDQLKRVLQEGSGIPLNRIDSVQILPRNAQGKVNTGELLSQLGKSAVDT